MSKCVCIYVLLCECVCVNMCVPYFRSVITGGDLQAYNSFLCK
jgi:hypothetical protein